MALKSKGKTKAGKGKAGSNGQADWDNSTEGLDKAWSQNRSGGGDAENVEPGIYPARLRRATMGVYPAKPAQNDKAAQPATPYVNFAFVLADGDSVGEQITVKHSLKGPSQDSTATRQQMFARDITKLDIETPDDLSKASITAIIEELNADKPWVQLSVKQNGEYTNYRILRLLSEDEVAEVESNLEDESSEEEDDEDETDDAEDEGEDEIDDGDSMEEESDEDEESDEEEESDDEEDEEEEEEKPAPRKKPAGKKPAAKAAPAKAPASKVPPKKKATAKK